MDKKSESANPNSIKYGDIENEVEVLNVIRKPTVPQKHPLTEQLCNIVKEVSSREAIRKSQEAIISQLKAELEKAQNTVRRQELILEEAASIMIEQQHSLEKVGGENLALKDELKQEKGKRISTEGKLARINEELKVMVDMIGESQVNRETPVERILPSDKEATSGCLGLESKISLLSKSIQDKMETWRSMQKKRKMDITKTKSMLQNLLDILLQKVSRPSSSKPNALKPTPTDAQFFKTYRILRSLSWSISTRTLANHRQGKHFRDITKRHRGFHCVCGLKYTSRNTLNRHIQHLGINYGEDDGTLSKDE